MLPQRIEAKINRTEKCWLWLAAKDKHGYGRVYWKTGAKFAHRIVYELLVGPTVLELDHLCRVHACVNPLHLEPVTHAVNVQRGQGPIVLSKKWAKPRNCPQGHPLSGDNLYEHYSLRLKRLNRQCRTCRRESKRRRRAAGAKD